MAGTGGRIDAIHDEYDLDVREGLSGERVPRD
jgi:hypothetical protein